MSQDSRSVKIDQKKKSDAICGTCPRETRARGLTDAASPKDGEELIERRSRGTKQSTRVACLQSGSLVSKHVGGKGDKENVVMTYRLWRAHL